MRKELLTQKERAPAQLEPGAKRAPVRVACRQTRVAQRRAPGLIPRFEERRIVGIREGSDRRGLLQKLEAALVVPE
jgi:hypothetical protein